jgi:16S rRNA (adenine1518-N6/adenine1519-N6)-dimethyltransferase
MKPSYISAASILKQYGLTPRKGLGQNFLDDPSILRQIVESAELPPTAAVLEIGPGLGSLTCTLAQAAGRVVAVELDKNLIPILQEICAPWQNIHIVQGDILKLDPDPLMGEDGYLVIANIPYNITSALIRHLLESNRKPARIVLTIQLEVARRICAAAGDLSLLALSVQVYGSPSIRMRIPGGAFYPPPKVDSAVVRIDIYAQPLIPSDRIETFFKLAKAGFSQKRKTLRNSLSGGMHISGDQAAHLLNSAGIDPQRRAQSLTIQEWGGLTDGYLRLSPA